MTHPPSPSEQNPAAAPSAERAQREHAPSTPWTIGTSTGLVYCKACGYLLSSDRRGRTKRADESCAPVRVEPRNPPASPCPDPTACADLVPVPPCTSCRSEMHKSPGVCRICGGPLNEVGTSRCYEAHGITSPVSRGDV